MNNMYIRIETLCKERNINMTQMCKDAGIPRGNLTDLKMGRTSALATKTLGKIAAYFNVSIDSLLGNAQKKAPSEAGAEDAETAELKGLLAEMSDDALREVLKFAQYQYDKERGSAEKTAK